MAKSFLRRFEKLENRPKEIWVKEGRIISKRFERLEVSDRRIEIAITDKITPLEERSKDIKYSFVCPYCGMDNETEAQSCSFCRASLVSLFADETRKGENLIKECSNCRAKNLATRKNCWVCGKGLFISNDTQIQQDESNVITLNIDGREYKSTDRNLPFDVGVLMSRIRRDGYSKDLIDSWLNERNSRIELEKSRVESRLSEIRMALVWRVIGLVLFLVLVIFQLRACFSLGHR